MAGQWAVASANSYRQVLNRGEQHKKGEREGCRWGFAAMLESEHTVFQLEAHMTINISHLDQCQLICTHMTQK